MKTAQLEVDATIESLKEQAIEILSRFSELREALTDMIVRALLTRHAHNKQPFNEDDMGVIYDIHYLLVQSSSWKREFLDKAKDSSLAQERSLLSIGDKAVKILNWNWDVDSAIEASWQLRVHQVFLKLSMFELERTNDGIWGSKQDLDGVKELLPIVSLIQEWRTKNDIKYQE